MLDFINFCRRISQGKFSRSDKIFGDDFTLIKIGEETFFLPGGENGVLLVHGFTGSPAELLLLGNFLNGAGFTVLGVRLAGHGTSEKNLLRMTREDWLNSALDGFSILKGCCKKIFVVGHSMGGLLALKLSLLCKAEKIVTIAAPIFVDEGFKLGDLPPREKCGKAFTIQPRRNLTDVPPAANQIYKKMPLLSVHELFDLIAETKKILPRIKTPLLILHAADDHTAQPKSAEFIKKFVGTSSVRLILVESGGHLLPLTESRDFVFETIKNFFADGGNNLA